VILFASLRILLKPTRVALDCFVAGIATLLAFNARQNCILFGAFPLLAVVLGPGRDAIVRAAAALLAGAVVGEAAVLGLMGTVGDVSGYFYTVFAAPGRYAGNVLGLIELIGFIRNDALVLVLVASLAALVRDVRALAFGAALIGVGVVSIVLPMRDHYYYWAQLLPVTSALVFLALRGQSTGTAWSTVAVLSVFLLGNAAWTVAKCVLRPTVYDYYAVAEEIDGLAPSAATLFVVGRDGAPVAFASRREAANSYFWDNFLFGPGGPGITPKPQAEILREYEQRPPGVLAVDEDVIGAIEGQPQGGLNAAWELVRRLLASGRYEDAGRHPGLQGGGTTTSWRYYRLQ
jgi:hypothetical protein